MNPDPCAASCAPPGVPLRFPEKQWADFGLPLDGIPDKLPPVFSTLQHLQMHGRGRFLRARGQGGIEYAQA